MKWGVILLGAPGAGKGTQAEYICNSYHIPKISTGDILRAEVKENTPIGQEVTEMMQKGMLVPDDLIMKLINIRLKKEDCYQGFLLDGFPRTIEQAKRLEIEIPIPVRLVIEIKVPDQTIINRLSGRRIHLSSGRIYHVMFHPSLNPGLDDVTGEPLVQREDDKEETIRHRLEIYHQQTEPLIDWYKQKSDKNSKLLHFASLDGEKSADIIAKDIRLIIENALID